MNIHFNQNHLDVQYAVTLLMIYTNINSYSQYHIYNFTRPVIIHYKPYTDFNKRYFMSVDWQNMHMCTKDI